MRALARWTSQGDPGRVWREALPGPIAGSLEGWAHPSVKIPQPKPSDETHPSRTSTPGEWVVGVEHLLVAADTAQPSTVIAEEAAN
jgi:hypothetical protein